MATHTASHTTATVVRIPGFALSMAVMLFGTVASGQIPSALRLEPRGVFATGSTSTFKVRNAVTGNYAYHFKYVGSQGDDTIEYVIDLDHPDVRAGLMRILETTTNSLPITEGGFTWRRRIDTGSHDYYDSPRNHSNYAGAVLIHEYLDPTTRVLTLKYKETRTPAGTTAVEARKTYEFWLVGKVLKIHASADGSVNKRFIDNYDFFQPGPATQVNGAHEQQIPYMDNTPVVAFQPSTSLPAQTAFYSVSDDYYSSSGIMGGWSIQPNPQPSNTWEQWYPLVSAANSHDKNPPYEILAAPDETLSLVVTSKVEDTFTVIPNYRSPYYALTSGRMMLFSSYQAPGSWNSYRDQYDALGSWGLNDTAIIQYMSKRLGPTGILFALPANENSAGVMGCQNIVRGPFSDPLTSCYPVDPYDLQNLASVATEFGALKDSARRIGALFAAIDCESGMDQWGTSEVKPQGIAHNVDYPIQRPLFVNDWTIGASKLGLICSAVPTGFNPSWVVRDSSLALKGQWDVGYNLLGTSWEDWGYLVGNVDARYIYELVTMQLQYGRDHYSANAVNYDASHFMPNDYVIDQTCEDPAQPLNNKTHTTGDFLKLQTKAVRDVRTYIGGPMYGEGNYWRHDQSYEYGARDGFRDNFPTGDQIGPNENNSASYVVPDFNLREVLPLAAGNSGMGFPGSHMADVSFPVDGIDGNSRAFLDSYITTSATYGNNGYSGTNGNIIATESTYEGIIRQYAYLEGLSRRMREGSLTDVTYYGAGANPQAYTLSQAIAAGTDVDLKNPRIRLRFNNGLVFYANHDVQGWTAWELPAAIPTLASGVTEQLTIYPNGFAAGDGTQLFVFFNGKPTAANVYPFDYVKYVNRWEAITTRDVNSNPAQQYTGTVYNGFPSTTVTSAFSGADLDLFSEATIYVDSRLNVAVGAHGGLWNVAANRWLDTPDGKSEVVQVSLGFTPQPTSLAVSSLASRVYTGKPEGMVARLTYGNGAWRDVTTLASWATSNGVIDQCGAVTASTPGSAVVTANYTPPGGSLMTASFSLAVADGHPSADAGADRTAYPGTAVTFDASSAADPKQGPVRCEWDFGDGAKAVGTKVDHVFAESPGTNRVVTLTVRDVEDNLGTDTANVTVNWSNTAFWWDNFDDGRLERYSQLAGDQWGICDGLVQQSKVDANYQELTITGAGHLYGDAAAGVEFKLINPSGTNYAGLHVRKALESDTPSDSGYKAVVSAAGVVSLIERGSGGVSQSATIPSFVATARHDLRVVEKKLPSTPPTRVRVYVDGKKYIEVSDSTTPGGGFAGLITYNQASQFDDFHITDGGAPVVTVVPLEYSASAAASFYVDDQDLFTDIDTGDPTSLKLTITAEDGPLVGTPHVFNGWSGSGSIATIATTPTLTYETGSASTSTWARVTMAQSIDATMNSFDPATKSISYEMIVHDNSSPAKYTRKYVRYTRP